MSRYAAEVNQLTAAWLRRTDGAGVLSGAGLWPLLAVLAWSAEEPGRGELAGAVGLPADECMDAARDILKELDALDGVDAALGLWAQQSAEVRPEWRDALPAGTFGELTGNHATDQPVLDAWARERTHGLIERFPVQAGPELMLTLATALALRTTWRQKFTDEPWQVDDGVWSGRRLAGLARTTSDPDDLRVAGTGAGPLTLTRVAGDNDLDVHLVLGEPGVPSGEVLAAAVPLVVEGADGVTGGSALLASGDVGPWPGVTTVSAQRPGLVLKTTRFSVRSTHDLLRQAEVFGLRSVSRSDTGHFPAIGPVPLRVDQASQAAVAIFSATGFEAAAITAIGLRTVSMPVHRTQALAVGYDRPYGFLSVHRPTGLVLFAGWVDSPEAWSAAGEKAKPVARPGGALRGRLPSTGRPE